MLKLQYYPIFPECLKIRISKNTVELIYFVCNLRFWVGHRVRIRTTRDHIVRFLRDVMYSENALRTEARPGNGKRVRNELLRRTGIEDGISPVTIQQLIEVQFGSGTA